VTDFAPSMQVKQYVAVVRGLCGRFRVFKTGSEKFYLFDAIDDFGCSTGLQFPVKRSDLRDDIRRALANGWGNSL
jgi:hypothetical protein